MEFNTDLSALPKGWVWTRLGEISEVVTGTTPSKTKKEYYGKDYPFYKPTDLNNGYYVRYSLDGLSEKGIKKSRLLPAKSILVTCIGATIGKTGFIRKAGASNQQINAIITKKGIYPENIFFFCLSPQFQKRILNNSSSTTLPILNKSKFEMLPIPLPPLPEQHRIVNKIDELFTKLDAGVDALKKIKIQIKNYRQAVLKNAFEGKLTQQWREAHKEELEPASVLLEKIKEQRKKESKGKFKELPPIDTSELSELPEGWVWTRLDYITQNITKGSTPTSYGFSYKKEGIKFIKTENIIEDGTIANIKDFIDEDANNFLKRSILQTYDILFSIAGTIGRVGLVQERDLPANTNQALSLIRLFSENIVNKYVFYFFKSPYIQKQSLKSIVGVGRANITLTDVSSYNIPLPPIPEQHQIVAEIESRFSVADQLDKVVEQSLKQAERLRKSILKQAFEGKLVPQDPTDEPAEKLLERIKEEKESRGLAKQKSGKRK